MSIRHFYSQTVADGTATSVVRPSDWNSAHNMVLNMGGNTLGTSQISGADIVWAGGNNVTLSANGSTVTIVGPNTVAQTVQTQASGNIVGAGFTSASTAGSDIVATQNSNGLSVGVPAYLTTAQPVGAYLTTAAQSDHSHNFATTTTGGSQMVVGTANSAGATVGVPAWITTYAAQTNQTQASGNIAGVGTTFAGTNVSGSMTLNSAGLNLALSAAAGGGGGGADGYNIIGVNGGATQLSTTYQLSDANNVSFGLNAGTITASASFPTQTVQTQASGNIVGAGFTSTTTAGTAVVATHNSAGLSMGVPAYLTTAGATNAITTAALSNHSHNFATTTTGGSNIVVGTTNSAGATIGVPAFLTTAAATNVTSGRAGTGTTFAGTNATATLGVDTNGVALSLSVAGGGVINQTGPNIAVAGSTITSGDVYFSNSPTVTFGMAGSTITASAAGGGGGGGVTVPYYEPYALGNNTSIFVFGQNTLYMQPLLPVDNVIVSNVELQVSIATTTTAAASNNVARTIKYGLYEYGTGASSGSLTLLGSSSMYINIYCDSNVSAGYTISQGAGSFTTTSAGTAVNSVLSGQKYMYFPFSTTLNAGGNYQWVMHMSSASTLSSHANRTFGMVILTNQTATTWGKLKTDGASIANASYLEEFDGRVYTATSSGLPSVFAESNCSVMNSKGRLYLKFENE